MRSYLHRPAHVCLPCLLRCGRRSFTTGPRRARPSAGGSIQPTTDSSPLAKTGFEPFPAPAPRIQSDKSKNGIIQRHASGGAGTREETASEAHSTDGIQTTLPTELSLDPEAIQLSLTQLQQIQVLVRWRSLLQSAVDKHTREQKVSHQGLLFEDALKLVKPRKGIPPERDMLQKLKKFYPAQDCAKVLQDLALMSEYRRKKNTVVTDQRTQELLEKFGIISDPGKGRKPPVPRRKSARLASTTATVATNVTTKAGKAHRREATKAALGSDAAKDPQPTPSPATTTGPGRRPMHSRTDSVIAQLEAGARQTLETKDLDLRPLEMGQTTVPGLSFDLSRVLFNPGVYQLQDPRSRVFNFDPYLERIMPVSEFDYEALNEYVTASRDDTLEKLAQERGKKYVGSTSSMTSALAHFHFLLSQWRPLNLQTLSKSFKTESDNFTILQRSPTSMFLRWKHGTYAVDADKEFESANVLMNLGKSMEKLFTLDKEEFERYRRSTQLGADVKPQPDPEVYHYTEQGDFLMRSQLDAYDARLPGTGMFDLKTRAVVAIRMSAQNHEEWMGYQIKTRFGSWESYEREFYDMIRSTFLKYSLQVRMGRMDGIFVAYHNVERIFGFQYISLPEMDVHLHGQYDTCLGDQEFKLSVKLLNAVFDRATTRFPAQSIRFHFDTREASASERSPYMYIFAEAMDEEDIDAIQTSRKGAVDAYNERVFNPPPRDSVVADDQRQHGADESAEASVDEGSDDADVDFLETVASEQENSSKSDQTEPDVASVPSSILAMKLTVRNVVNGQHVVRPENIQAEDVWTLEYTLVELPQMTGLRKYNVCRARRKSAFDISKEENDTTNFYLQRIKRLTEEGAAWRRERDEADAQRGVVVLYGDPHAGT